MFRNFVMEFRLAKGRSRRERKRKEFAAIIRYDFFFNFFFLKTAAVNCDNNRIQHCEKRMIGEGCKDRIRFLEKLTRAKATFYFFFSNRDQIASNR